MGWVFLFVVALFVFWGGWHFSIEVDYDEEDTPGWLKTSMKVFGFILLIIGGLTAAATGMQIMVTILSHSLQ